MQLIANDRVLYDWIATERGAILCFLLLFIINVIIIIIIINEWMNYFI